MSDTQRKLDALLLKDRFRTVLTVVAISMGMFAMGGLLNIFFEPKRDIAHREGVVAHYRVAQNGRLWGGSTPYWVVEIGRTPPIVVREPPSRDFRQGNPVCLVELEGIWTGRRTHRVAAPDDCTQR